jgi:hypothetical protein
MLCIGNAPVPQSGRRSLDKEMVELDQTKGADAAAGNFGKAADSDPLPAYAAQPSALPRFPQAMREYIIGSARFRESPRLLNKLVSHDARWRVVGYLLYLAVDRERFGPAGGASYGRLPRYLHAAAGDQPARAQNPWRSQRFSDAPKIVSVEKLQRPAQFRLTIPGRCSAKPPWPCG